MGNRERCEDLGRRVVEAGLRLGEDEPALLEVAVRELELLVRERRPVRLLSPAVKIRP
jgi:hypothetical protein